VQTLASDELEGRGTGEPGCQKAAAYIADAFKALGLRPVCGREDFRQVFEATISVSLGDSNRLEILSSEIPVRALVVKTDFIPFAFSASGRAHAPIVFAGYGITAPEKHFDDYAESQVAGKIVLLLRHEPQENDSASVFDGRRDTRHAEFRTKAKNAAEHGAVGVLIVTDPLHHASEDDDLVPFGSGIGAEGSVSIPVIHVKRAAVESLWGAGLSVSPPDLKSAQEEIDATLRPKSFAVTGCPVRLQVEIDPIKRPTDNVVAYLPPSAASGAGASRPAFEEYVVIGAHYDHLGMGGRSSLAPDSVAVHNGADDNASGTAALIEVARALSHDPAPRERGIVFAAFTGEELGLLGSSWFVNHPPLPLDGAMAMLNMDMVGRMKDNRLQIGGVGTSPTFKPLLENMLATKGVTPDYSESGYGPSDHTSFYAKDRPVLFFFTGAHEDYHRPSDDWQKINFEGLGMVAEIVAGIAKELAGSREAVLFARAAEDSAGPRGAGGGGYGAYLGTVPDFGQSDPGVKLAAVRAGGPAEKAGIKAGDVIVEFDGKAIQNLYDLTDELRAHRPGDVVRIGVQRGPEKFVFAATLGKR
jgi:hypothetical protein